MAYKAPIPAGQPRTLRSIAESKGTSPAAREGEIPYVAQSGMPITAPGAAQMYHDNAAADSTSNPTPAARATGLVDPKPFANLRKR